MDAAIHVSSAGCVCYNAMYSKVLVLMEEGKRCKRDRDYHKVVIISVLSPCLSVKSCQSISAIMSVHGTLRRIRWLLSEQRRFRVDAPQNSREPTHSDPPSKWGARYLMQGTDTECYFLLIVVNFVNF